MTSDSSSTSPLITSTSPRGGGERSWISAVSTAPRGGGESSITLYSTGSKRGGDVSGKSASSGCGGTSSCSLPSASGMLLRGGDLGGTLSISVVISFNRATRVPGVPAPPTYSAISMRMWSAFAGAALPGGI